MEEINESQPVLGHLLRCNGDFRPVDDPQPFKSRQPVSNLAPFVPQAVGEAQEEAGKAADY